ncbi:MAG: tyrosine recombinase XerC [Coriobacteriales bacterium]|nr:tyrosine recombinase XerC [Coriobacteriales bacterium]
MKATGTEGRKKALAQARRETSDYLAYLRDVRRVSSQTIRSYGADLEGFVAWCEREGTDPINASRLQLRRYVSDMVSAGYADVSINRKLTTLRTFYRWLESHDKIAVSEAESIPGRKTAKTLPLAMSDEEVSRMIDACDDETTVGLRDHAFIELLYATGARISEMAQLEPADIDFSQGEVRLFGKGSKERIVPVYARALEVTSTYLAKARPTLVRAAKKGPHATAVFVSKNGNNMSDVTLRRRFELLVKKAGLEHPYTPHAMRHTYATELLSGGADLKAVQELLGHESLVTTQIYTHLSIERLKEATKQAHPRG